ncbi:MAG: ABC transporter permease subunit [Pseudomonadota bacterium]|nr:ABC transporter permease subunit [Gammaproteobacteria bacterium]MDQ3580164.1 ABC transporter permease subunit [Pseudomonadota bacterium]
MPHVLSTLSHLLLGAGLGGLLGSWVALLAYQSMFLRMLVGSLLEGVRVIPPLIIIPFVLIVGGPTEVGQVIVAMVFAALSMFVYAINALENVPRQFRIIGQLLAASRWQIITTVEIPAIVPELLGGARITLALTLGIVVVAEYLGAPSGIGRVLKFAISFSNVELIVVGMMWAGIIGVAGNQALGAIIGVFARWR